MLILYAPCDPQVKWVIHKPKKNILVPRKWGGRMIHMKTKAIIEITNSVKTIVNAITNEIVERIEESCDSYEARARHNQLRNEWFSRFKSLPASYHVTTYRSSTYKVEFETDNAVLVAEKDGGGVYVATPFVDESGTKMYMVRDIYGVDEYAIPREEVTLLYKGSVENCWLRWYISTKNKLG